MKFLKLICIYIIVVIADILFIVWKINDKKNDKEIKAKIKEMVENS